MERCKGRQSSNGIIKQLILSGLELHLGLRHMRAETSEELGFRHKQIPSKTKPQARGVLGARAKLAQGNAIASLPSSSENEEGLFQQYHLLHIHKPFAIGDRNSFETIKVKTRSDVGVPNNLVPSCSLFSVHEFSHDLAEDVVNLELHATS